MTTLWHPFTPMQAWSEEPQLTISSAQGNYLIDGQGTRYLDAISSLWTNVHGHNHPVLNEAIITQVHQVAHTTLLGLTSPPAQRLADELVRITPPGLNHVFYSDSGSTAVEVALKQAFQYWQLIGRPSKKAFVHLDQAYHGDTLGAVAVGGIDLFHEVYGPLILPTLSIPTPATTALDAMTPSEAKQRSLDALAKLFESRANEIAALIIEPLVQGAGGLLVHPPGFLAAAAKLCREHDVLLIADEVATGFGRTGRLFACEHEDVSPDFLCLAKGITGGYLPLAATLSTSKVFEAFLAPRAEGKTFFHGHTYTGNALACAAAIANIGIFEADDTIARMQPKIEGLQARLAELEGNPWIGDVRQRGFMVGIELVDTSTRRSLPADAATGHRVCLEARRHGVILRNLGDVIVLMPPLSITLEEIDTMVRAAETSIGAILNP